MSNQHVKITVLTVCFNSEKTIEESVLSVVNQSYDNVEYIIIDGCSTDGTLEVLEKYRDKISLLISEKDGGIYDAINKGLMYASGDFLIVLGSDDHFLSYSTLEKVASKLRSQNSVYYGNVYMEEFNEIFYGKYNKYKRAETNYCHQSIFYPKSVYKNYKYDLKYKLCADNDYNFRVSEKFPFEYIGNTISFYSYGGASGARNDVEWYKVRRRMIIDHCGIIAFLYLKNDFTVICLISFACDLIMILSFLDLPALWLFNLVTTILL